MPAQWICDSPRLLRAAAGAALLCLASIVVAQSARQTASRSRQSPVAGSQTLEASGAAAPTEAEQQGNSAGSSAAPMTSSELASQLSGVKDNSLVIANKYISGPLILNAEQRPITPVNFKVEFRDCEFADGVV